MYSRNCGSNCPRSCALIARSTRGSALMGPGPISSRGAGLISSGISVVLQPVAGDIDAPGNPGFFSPYVLQELFKRCEPSRAADEAAMQAHRHHAPAFGVEHVEAVLQVVEKIRPRVEALRRGEAHVVRVEGIGHDELRFSIARVVPGQLVAVIV